VLLKVREKAKDIKMPVIAKRMDSSFYISKLLYRNIPEQKAPPPSPRKGSKIGL
jgi:hypothetical protein